MCPAIHVFGIHVPLFSTMAVLGVIAYFVMYFILIEKVEKVDRQTSNRMLLVSLLGLAALAVFAYLFNSLYHSIEAGEVQFGGITWLGGLIGMVPVLMLGAHFLTPKFKGDIVHYISLIIPGMVLGHAFGRFGCFFGGCCYGKVTDGPFGVIFPVGSAAAIEFPAADGRSLPVLPTQLFEAAFELCLFIVMMVTRKKTKSYSLAIYVIAYSVFRFACEFMRGDDRGALAGALSPSQWSCILFLIFGVALILYQKGITFDKLKQKQVLWKEQAVAWVPVSIGKEARTLEDLDALYKKGILTKSEYETKKKEVLKRM